MLVCGKAVFVQHTVHIGIAVNIIRKLLDLFKILLQKQSLHLQLFLLQLHGIAVHGAANGSPNQNAYSKKASHHNAGGTNQNSI